MIRSLSLYGDGKATFYMYGWSGHSQLIGMVWAQSIYRDGLATVNI